MLSNSHTRWLKKLNAAREPTNHIRTNECLTLSLIIDDDRIQRCCQGINVKTINFIYLICLLLPDPFYKVSLTELHRPIKTVRVS